MNPTNNFSKLNNYLKFTIQIELETPLHIGGNFDDVLSSDLPIIRTNNGTPYIPGSSLKGVLRTASERLTYILQDELGQDSCLLDKGGCGLTHNEKINDILGDTRKSEEQKYYEVYDILCPTCRTFGAGSLASKIRVNHVMLPESKSKVRDGIKIDRETGTVAPGAKFEYEYVEAGVAFTIEIEAENMTKENEKVLGLALAQLKSNMVRVGGLQARGLGQLKFRDGDVERMDFNQSDRTQIIQYLLRKGNPTQKLKLEEYLSTIYGG